MKINVVDNKRNTMFYVEINFSKYFFSFAPIITRNEFSYLRKPFNEIRKKAMGEYLANINDEEEIKKIEAKYWVEVKDLIDNIIKEYSETNGIILYTAISL